MKNKGFTLVELLSVLLIMSLLVVIAIPASKGIGNRIKKQQYTTKVSIAEKAAISWGQDNRGLFKSAENCEPFLDIIADENCDLSSAGMIKLKISYQFLAEQGYIKNESDIEGEVFIENPIDKENMSNDEVILVYNFEKRNFEIEIDKEYIVTLNFNNKDKDSKTHELKCNLNNNDCILKPTEDIENANHILKGWDTSQKSNTARYKNEAVVRFGYNTTLYAVWEPKQYKLTLNSNTDREETKDIQCYYNRECVIPPQIFTKVGNSIKGWGTSPTSTKEEEKIIITKNTELYAIWEPMILTVHFDLNGGSLKDGEKLNNIECHYDKVCPIKAGLDITPKKEGNKFLGWKMDSEIIDPQKISTITITTNTILVAEWKPRDEDLILDHNDNSGQKTTIQCEYGLLCDLKNIEITSVGKEFKGLGTSPTSTKGEEKITITKTTTLYAIWETIKLNVNFFGNGADGTSPTMDAQICNYGESCKINVNKFIKKDYNFIGWSTTLGGTVAHTNEKSISITSDLNLYAVWKEIDKTPPVINFNPSTPGVYINSLGVTISVTDNDTGVNNIKYCTSTNSSCTPNITTTNGRLVTLYGRYGTDLTRTLCVVATDNNNNTSQVKCENYKIDSESPSVKCTPTGSWSKTRSNVDCTATDNYGLRRLEWSNDSTTWTAFGNINISGNPVTSYTSNFNATNYRNAVRATDLVGLTYDNNYIYANIDKTPPLVASIDIKNTLSDSSNNVSSISCTNNEYLANGEYNSSYNEYANNICTLYTRNTRLGWTMWWYDGYDDWKEDDGYSGRSHYRCTGTCYYNPDEIFWNLTSGSGRSLKLYTVDNAGNESPYYFQLTVR